MAHDPRYLAYFHHFNRHEYFAAHEVLEGLWLETRDERRDFYKGLIQTAAVFLKLQQAKPDPASRLAQRALGLLQPYEPHREGLDVRAVTQRLRAVLAGRLLMLSGIAMRLIQVLAIVMTELSVGLLLLTSLLPPREIRTSFFTFNSLLAAIAAALALLLVKFGAGSAWWDVRYLGLTVIGATMAFGSFKLEKAGLGRLCLTLSGLLGLGFGLMPLAERMLTLRGLETKIPLYFDASALAGAALLGTVTTGMILGHWYLVMRRLSFEHLELFAKILLGAALFRGFVLVVVLGTLKQADPKLAEVLLPPLAELGGNAFFFLLRLVLGIGGPLVLGYMTLRCVREQNNQAATGLLYIAMVSVLFGEMFAALLLV